MAGSTDTAESMAATAIKAAQQVHGKTYVLLKDSLLTQAKSLSKCDWIVLWVADLPKESFQTETAEPVPIKTFPTSTDKAHWSNDEKEIGELQKVAKGPPSSSVLVVPVFYDDAIFALLQLSFEQHVENEQSLLAEMEQFAVLVSGQLFHGLQHHTQHRLSGGVIELAAQSTFTNLDDLALTLHRIVATSVRLMDAEFGSLFFVDEASGELVAKVFNAGLTKSESELVNIRLPAGTGIAGMVVRQKRVVVVNDVSKHPNFFAGLDKQTALSTRNLIAIPVFKEDGDVTAVIEVLNKKSAGGFSQSDETTAILLASQVASLLRQSLLLTRLLQRDRERKVLVEMLTYHWRVPDAEVQQFVGKFKEGSLPDHVRLPSYSPTSDQPDDVVLFLAWMIRDLGLQSRWSISDDTLLRFLLFVRTGYRPVPYHNFFHAASVAHFAFLLNSRYHALELIPDQLALDTLFIACLCHDLDHRGTNNQHQVNVGSSLGSLYASEGSVMERHHLAQTMMLLDIQGCNITSSLSSETVERVRELLSEIILATDLGNHFKSWPTVKELCSTPQNIDTKKTEHKHMMLSLLMTSCDLCTITKPWEVSYPGSELIFAEFFFQGDLEKAKGKSVPEMFDRTIANKRKIQLGFIENVAQPVYEALAQVLPSTAEAQEAVRKNHERWTNMPVINE